MKPPPAPPVPLDDEAEDADELDDEAEEADELDEADDELDPPPMPPLPPVCSPPAPPSPPALPLGRVDPPVAHASSDNPRANINTERVMVAKRREPVMRGFIDAGSLGQVARRVRLTRPSDDSGSDLAVATAR